MQTNDDVYTSESRVATSPTLSFTTGVIGANDDVLDMVPEAEGPCYRSGMSSCSKSMAG